MNEGINKISLCFVFMRHREWWLHLIYCSLSCRVRANCAVLKENNRPDKVTGRDCRVVVETGKLSLSKL